MMSCSLCIIAMKLSIKRNTILKGGFPASRVEDTRIRPSAGTRACKVLIANSKHANAQFLLTMYTSRMEFNIGGSMHAAHIVLLDVPDPVERLHITLTNLKRLR